MILVVKVSANEVHLFKHECTEHSCYKGELFM